MTTSESDAKTSPGLRLVVIVAIGVALVVVVAGSCLTWINSYAIGGDEGEWTILGTRGDFWGGHLAPMAGFVGVVLMFIALLLQKAELALQRKELRDSREVAKQQAESLASQAEKLETQNRLAQFQADVAFLDLLANRTGELNWAAAQLACLTLAGKAIVLIAKNDRASALDMLVFCEASLMRSKDPHQSLDRVLAKCVAEFAPELGRAPGKGGTWREEARSVLRGLRKRD